MAKFRRFVAAALLFGSTIAVVSVDPDSLRANSRVGPLDVDTVTPRLSWRLKSDKRGNAQTAIQIVASSSQDFTAPDLWDSGKVESSEPFAYYDGSALASRAIVNWRVRVWDADDQASDWSAAARFQIALLSEEDWEASWITNVGFKTGTTYLPAFAKEFSLDCDVAQARLYILGLGLFIPEINGKEITDHVLQPGYSTVNDTLPYSTHDVSKFLAKGNNVLGVTLGKGIYDAEEPLLGRYRKFAQAYQQLRMIAQLEYICENGEEGRIVSDDSWLTTLETPYWETSWYGGEEYDARKEVENWSHPDGDRSEWSLAIVTQGPPGKLVSPRSPPMKVFETIEPVSVTKNEDGFYVYDFGVNFAGTFAFTMKQPDLEGTRITFWPDERPGLSQSTTGGPTFDGYTLSKSPSQTYSPKFLYHGFQYLGVNTTWEPALDDVVGLVIRAANEPVLSFSSSSELFNGIHNIIDRSIQGNMHSVLTDCPHREKYGWLEQDHLVFEPVALGYDIEAYGEDLIRQMGDAQAEDVPGLIPDIAPEFGKPMGGGYRNDPNWGRAIINVPYQLYQYYGDTNVLKMRHQFMIEYLDYLQGRAAGKPYLNDGGLGDWLAIDTKTPKGVASTFGYHQAAYYLAKIEKILGNEDVAAKYASLADEIIDGFNSMWLNTTSGPTHYCPISTQGCNAFALDMGAVPKEHEDAVLTVLIDSLEANNGLITVGEIALPSLFRVLRAAGRDDLLYRWMSHKDMPSYGYMLEHGATSLWEHWDADETGGSLNHFMYGYGDLFLLQLSGLQQKNSSVAWSDIVFHPIIQGDLTHASTTYLTPRGLASASWSLDGESFTYEIEVPVGSTGWVIIEGERIKEGGKCLKAGVNGILDAKRENERGTVKVGSGFYSFSATVR